MILLHILKIVGIILLILLLALAACVLLVLFVPVRYRASGYIRQGFCLKASISALFHLIGFSFYTKDDRQEAYVRILWIKKKLFEASDTDSEIEDEIGSAIKTEVKETEKELEQYIKEQETINDIPDDVQENAPEAPAKDPVGYKKERKARDRKGKKAASNRFRIFFDNMKAKIKDIGTAASVFRKFIEDPVHRSAFSRLKKELHSFLKAAAPSKLKLKAQFSTGAPDTTGILLGVLALFPAAYKNRWEITPDFEADKMYVEADFDVRGHIFCYKILGILLRIFFDSDCRKLYQDINTIKNSQ